MILAMAYHQWLIIIYSRIDYFNLDYSLVRQQKLPSPLEALIIAQLYELIANTRRFIF